MIDSFRNGVMIWLQQQLTADFYLAPSNTQGAGHHLQTELLAQLKPGLFPGIAAVSIYRWTDVRANGKPSKLVAADLAPESKAGYQLLSGNPEQIWQQLATTPSVIISEPLAYRQQLVVDDELTLLSPNGPLQLRIAGIYHDYSSEHGRILIDRRIYQRYWQDTSVSSMAIFADDSADLTSLGERIKQAATSIQAIVLRSDRDIFELTLTIFNRTFAITDVLRLLAIVVAFVGMLSALLAVQLERAREFSVLRALGMARSEMGALIGLQTGFMGFLAGLLALPVGLLLAAVLIFVINRRAFGWTLPYEADPVILIQCVVLATGAALLAGVYPIWQIGRTHLATHLRFE